MSQPTATLPGFLRFTWMFFMQPLPLHRLLASNGVVPDAPFWWYLSVIGPNRMLCRGYLARLAAVLFVLTPIIAAAIAGLASWKGFPVDWLYLIWGVAEGVILGAAFGGASGVTLGVAFGLTAGLVRGVPDGLVQSVAPAAQFGVVGLVAIGVAVGVPAGLVFGAANGLATAFTARFRTLLLGLAFGVIFGVTTGVKLGENAGADVGVTFGFLAGQAELLAFYLAMMRLPLWPIEACLQAILFSCRRLFPRSLLRSSVHWHELSFFPIPFLGRHIEATAEIDPELALQTLLACANTVGQRAVGRHALARLQGKELETIAREGRFLSFTEAETTWLPSEAGSDQLIDQLRQVARFLVAAEGSSFPHHRLGHVRKAEKALASAQLQLVQASRAQADALSPAFPTWQTAIASRRREAEAAAGELLPMPFRAGEPLSPERGRDVFRGREESIRQIEAHLALASDARSVALLGPRRTGKSSLLQILPIMLPDAICVFFDLQGNPQETPKSFFRALARTTREQARRSHKLRLPDLPTGPPFEAATAWIETLENTLGERRLLICIDEFEALERSFGDSRDDLLRLLGIFRSTIQHRRKVRLLLAGEASFDELDDMWDAHFVSVRELRLGHLNPQVAFDLVRKPIPEFPDDAIPEPVARRLVERTGAQPFLVQLLAQMLVSHLNDEKRRSATLEDLEQVENEALGQVGSYFRDMWNRAPLPAKEALTLLARGERPEIPKAARRWLERRCLVDSGGGLTIPIFGRFLLEEILD